MEDFKGNREKLKKKPSKCNKCEKTFKFPLQAQRIQYFPKRIPKLNLQENYFDFSRIE